METIYLNNAGTTKPSRSVIKRNAELLEGNWMNPSGLEGTVEKRMIEEAREIIKDILNADDVVFNSGATEGNNTVLNNSAYDKVIVAPYGHPSVIKHQADTFHMTDEGMLDIEWFNRLMESDTANRNVLVSVPLVDNETGIIAPISKMKKSNNYKLHIDGTQAVGKMAIDMKAMGINYLTASAHKFNGLKGVGFIAYNGVKPIVSNIGGGQEHGFRSGTEDVAGIVTTAMALDEHNRNLMENNLKVLELNWIMRKELSSIPDIKFNTPVDDSTPYVINVSFKNVNGEALTHMLSIKGVIVSAGSACHSGSIHPSTTLTVFKVPPEYIHGTIRISFSPENTKEEIAYAAEKIKECVNIIRKLKE